MDTQNVMDTTLRRTQTNGITQNRVELARKRTGRAVKRKNKNWRLLVHWLRRKLTVYQ
jgi:ribosomal protein L16/L10AE